MNRLTVIANESYEDFARTFKPNSRKISASGSARSRRSRLRNWCAAREDGTETEIGQDKSAEIWDGLVTNGYLNAAGDILDKFDPKNPHFELKVDDRICGLARRDH